ncbi:MAG: cell division topological specificity factor MinE [Synechococcaceae cyanobacterium]
MTLLDFINRLLGRQKPSASMARERLQLVLAHDRSDLNPELLEQMRREILEVVQRYVEIDLESGDVSLETGDRVTALVANLPIRRARPQPLAAPTPTGTAEAPDASPAPSPDAEDQAEAESAPTPAGAIGEPVDG